MQEKHPNIQKVLAPDRAHLPSVPEAAVRISIKGQKNPLVRTVERCLKQPLMTEAIAAALRVRECSVTIQVDERITVPEFAIKKHVLSIFLPKRVSHEDRILSDVRAFIIESAVLEVGLTAACEAVEKGSISESARKQLSRFAHEYPTPPKHAPLTTPEVLYCAVSSHVDEMIKLRDGLVAKIQGSGVFSPERAFQVGAENAKRFAHLRAISELLSGQPRKVVEPIPQPSEVVLRLSYRLAEALYCGQYELAAYMSNAYDVMTQLLSEGGYLKPFPIDLKPRAPHYSAIPAEVDGFPKAGSLLDSTAPIPRSGTHRTVVMDSTQSEAASLVRHLRTFAALPRLVESLRSQDPSQLEGDSLLSEMIEHGVKLPQLLSDIRAGKEHVDLEPLADFLRATLSLRFSAQEGAKKYFELVAYGRISSPGLSEPALKSTDERILTYVNLLEVSQLLQSLPAARAIKEIEPYEKDLCVTAMRGLRVGAFAYENSLSEFLREGADGTQPDSPTPNEEGMAAVEADLTAFRDAVAVLIPLMPEEHRQVFVDEMTRAANGIRDGMVQLQLRRLSNDELVERLTQLKPSSHNAGLLSKSLQLSSAELLQRIRDHAEATANKAAQNLSEMASEGRLQDLVEYSATLLKLAALEPDSAASQNLVSAVVQYVGEIAPLLRECHARALDRVNTHKPGTKELSVADVHRALEALSSFSSDVQAMLCGLREFEDLLPKHFFSTVRINLELEAREMAESLGRMPRLLGDVVVLLARELESDKAEVKEGAAAAIAGLRVSRMPARAVPESARGQFEKLVRRT